MPGHIGETATQLTKVRNFISVKPNANSTHDDMVCRGRHFCVALCVCLCVCVLSALKPFYLRSWTESTEPYCILSFALLSLQLNNAYMWNGGGDGDVKRRQRLLFYHLMNMLISLYNVTQKRYDESDTIIRSVAFHSHFISHINENAVIYACAARVWGCCMCAIIKAPNISVVVHNLIIFVHFFSPLRCSQRSCCCCYFYSC